MNKKQLEELRKKITTEIITPEKKSIVQGFM